MDKLRLQMTWQPLLCSPLNPWRWLSSYTTFSFNISPFLKHKTIYVYMWRAGEFMVFGVGEFLFLYNLGIPNHPLQTHTHSLLNIPIIRNYFLWYIFSFISLLFMEMLLSFYSSLFSYTLVLVKGNKPPKTNFENMKVIS